MKYSNNAMTAELDQARRIKRSLGVRCAAGYMRNRGWSLEAALHILGRK